MKLVTFENNNHISIGAVKDDHVIDFSNSSLPNEMIEFIKLGEEGLDKANDLIESPQNELSINTLIPKMI